MANLSQLTYVPTFQSYKSSIQTLAIDAVRDSPICSFNPIIVRFKRSLPNEISSTGSPFQSYNSSIQTYVLWSRNQVIHLPFNPIIVRFKHVDKDAVEYVVKFFQSCNSSIQTIGAAMDEGAEVVFQSYNSSIQTLPYQLQ